MAVSEADQGKEVGGKLLLQAFRLAHAMSREVGCAGIVVDAKPTARGYYARYGFEDLVAEQGLLPVGGGVVPMFLSLGELPAV